MAIPTYEKLMLPLLEMLKDNKTYTNNECIDILAEKMNVTEEAGRAIKKTGDEGIDGIINEDRLGLDSIYIQAKRWKNTVVGRPEIQKFSGALDTPGASKGIFITTSTFSKEAREYVKTINSKNIILIDGIQLAQYMIEFNVGVSTEIVYEVKRIDNDYFTEE